MNAFATRATASGLLVLTLLIAPAATPVPDAPGARVGVGAAVESDYAAEVKEIGKAVRGKVSLHESPNFVFALACSTAEAKPIIDAVEKGYKHFQGITGVEGWESMWGPKKALFAVLKNRLQYRNFIKWYAEKYKDSPYMQWPFEDTATRVTYWPQPIPRVFAAMHLKPSTLKSLRNTAVHVLGHLCMMRYKFNNSPIPPWLEEGFGCYLEAATLGRNNCYCFSGGYGDKAARLDKLTDIEWSKWKDIVRGMVRKKSDKVMKQILPMRMTELSAAEMGKAWSVIDYLVRQDKKKFARWVEATKAFWPRTFTVEYTDEKGAAQERALKDVLEMDFDGLDTAWRAWAGKGMK